MQQYRHAEVVARNNRYRKFGRAELPLAAVLPKLQKNEEFRNEGTLSRLPPCLKKFIL